MFSFDSLIVQFVQSIFILSFFVAATIACMVFLIRLASSGVERQNKRSRKIQQR
jgi:hypothetical protein